MSDATNHETNHERIARLLAELAEALAEHSCPCSMCGVLRYLSKMLIIAVEGNVRELTEGLVVAPFGFALDTMEQLDKDPEASRGVYLGFDVLMANMLQNALSLTIDFRAQLGAWAQAHDLALVAVPRAPNNGEN